MSGRIVKVERVFDAPKNLVWRALTEKELMKLWYFDLAEFKAELGFRFEFMGGPPDGVQHKHLCEITQVDFEQKLSYSWKYDGYEGESHVSFELFPENESTRLVLTHTGLDTFPQLADFAIANFEAGWNDIINKLLKEFLETHPF